MPPRSRRSEAKRPAPLIVPPLPCTRSATPGYAQDPTVFVRLQESVAALAMNRLPWLSRLLLTSPSPPAPSAFTTPPPSARRGHQRTNSGSLVGSKQQKGGGTKSSTAISKSASRNRDPPHPYPVQQHQRSSSVQFLVQVGEAFIIIWTTVGVGLLGIVSVLYGALHSSVRYTIRALFLGNRKKTTTCFQEGEQEEGRNKTRRTVLGESGTPETLDRMPSDLLSEEDGDEWKARSHSKSGGEPFMYYDVEEASFQPNRRLLYTRSMMDCTQVQGVGEDGASTGIPMSSPLTAAIRSPQENAGDPLSLDGVSAALAPSTCSFPNSHEYFHGKFGDCMWNGTFRLIAEIGRGAYSTVWLAVDLLGATAELLPAMVMRMEVAQGYNKSSAVLSRPGGWGAYVVLKISRNNPAYVRACEKEFETNKSLMLELQRCGFSDSLRSFALYPLSFLQSGGGSSGGEEPLRSDKQPCYFVQVGEVCGPSLLNFVMQYHVIPPPLLLKQCRWRLRSIRRIILNLVECLSAMHACGLVHTDLKPENILFGVPDPLILEKMKKRSFPSFSDAAHRVESDIDLIVAPTRYDILMSQEAAENVARDHAQFDVEDVLNRVTWIKLADLGSSIHVYPLSSSDLAEYSRRVLQTREYRAPEVIVQLLPESSMLSSAMDVWSVGCLTFELLTGSYLFNPRYFAEAPLLSGAASLSPHQIGEQQQQAPSSSVQQPTPTADVQQGIGASAVKHILTSAQMERRMDIVHLDMMRELLGLTVPEAIRVGGRKSKDLFSKFVLPEGSSPPPTPSKAGSMIGLLLQQRLGNFYDPRELEVMASFLSCCLRWLPEERWTATSLMKHPWVTSI